MPPTPSLLPAGTTRRLARLGGLDWIGMPVVNSFGQQEGSLLLGYGRAGIADRLTAIALAMAGPGLTALAIGLPLAWFAVFLVARPTRGLFAQLAGCSRAARRPRPMASRCCKACATRSNATARRSTRPSDSSKLIAARAPERGA